MIKRIKPSHVMALALTMTGCEFIGPQIHTKLPVPAALPSQDEPVPNQQDAKNDDGKKTTKVEIISGIEDVAPAKSYFATGEKPAGKGEYSLNFDDADLGEVAKVILSDILGKNYTISPQVTGKVTLQTTRPLSKEELLPTLDMLLNLNNAALINQNGLYLIKPSTEALYSSNLQTSGMPNGYQIQVVPVRNVAASEIAEILKPLLPEKALLQVDANRNLLLVAGAAAELKRATELINIFDVDMLKGRSFALFTPAHADASVIIDELEQIFNNSPGSSSGAGKTAAKKDKDAGAGGGAGAAGSGSNTGSFYRFIEIDRLNAILAITRKSQSLKEIESWVLRLDKANTDGKGGVNVYRVQHHGAMDLARTLSSIFGNGQQNSSSASTASGLKPLSASNGSSGSSGGGGAFGGSSGSSSGFGSSGSSGSSMGGMSGSSGGSSSGSGGQSLFSAFGSSSGSSGSSGMGGGQPLMPNVKIIADEGNNALIIVANTQEYSTIQKVIKQLDVLPLQVLIDATIVEVSLTNELKYGIEWYLNAGRGVNGITGGGGGSSNITNLASAAASGLGSSGFSYLFSSSGARGGLNAVLNAAAKNNSLNIISSPSLMVLNNQQAAILVGDSVPIITGTSATITTSNPVQSNTVQMVDTGVNLAIRPRVNANGLVLMDIMQSVNEVDTTAANNLSSGSASIQTPSISKREIQTSVAVQSGETIVLGGLIQETDTYNRNGVPWFHEIPLIGPLFGSTDRQKDKTELVVMLTPRVMKSRQDAQLVTEEIRHKLTGIYDYDDNINVEVEEVQ